MIVSAILSTADCLLRAIKWALSAEKALTLISLLYFCHILSTSSHLFGNPQRVVWLGWSIHNEPADSSHSPPCLLLFPPTPAWFTMTTESGADSEAKPQENKETEKAISKAADPTSPENQPAQLPVAAGHSTPVRKEQVRPVSQLLTSAQETKSWFTASLTSCSCHLIIYLLVYF